MIGGRQAPSVGVAKLVKKVEPTFSDRKPRLYIQLRTTPERFHSGSTIFILGNILPV